MKTRTGLINLFAILLCSMNMTQAQNKILIAYFSLSGNTQEVAKQIQKHVGGALFEIEVVTPYPEVYDQVTKQAKQEITNNYKPALKNKIKNIEDFDIIFIGSPCWWHTIAPPVASFLAAYDLSGKIIIPFMTHEGSGLGKSVEDIKNLCPKSTVSYARAMRGGKVSLPDTQKEINKWLDAISDLK